LSCSVTKTAQIKGISQAGIPGKMHLTPTLDAEFLATKEVRSLDNIATTIKGIPTPALITRAVHELKPFSNLEFLNLGFEILPKFYTILAETIPAGTTTAMATALALGYDCKEFFSSSFKNSPNNIKDEVLKKALENIKPHMDIFERLSYVSDNMIVFNAGFILGLQATKHKLILAGGTQMAAVLLTTNSILKTMGGEIDSSKLALCTTKWLFEDENSNIKALLELLDFKINAYNSQFDFSTSKSKVLKLYDKGEAKEGVGAGAALIYASINGIKKEDIINKVEEFLGE
jgi:NaMN:DMB phosphoribosyltransferase